MYTWHMRACGNKTISWHQRSRFRFNGRVASVLGVLLLWIGSLLSPEIACATTIYSYIDEQGTPVLTDNFESIPERYRAKVQVTEQAPKGPSEHSAAIRLQQKVAGWIQNAGAWLSVSVPSISGLTRYQSQVLNFGGIAAMVCLLIRTFLRSEIIRFLSLWCLIMLGVTVPAVLFTSKDAPLDRLLGQLEKVQEKQPERLPRVP